jgi:hypothetical protein
MPTATSPAPARVLIPEARDHQRRRYLRTGLTLALGALALAGLVAFLVVLTTGAAPGNRTHGAQMSAAGAAGGRPVVVRPVLCAAPPFSAAAIPSPVPETCGPHDADTPAALDVQPLHHGFTMSTPPPEPALAADPTSVRDVPSATVLLDAPAGGAGPRGTRVLLGPSVMTLSHSTVATATVHQTPARVWEVVVRLDAKGSARWDAVAHQFFHGLVAIDFDGRAVSTPLIEPTAASFSSFDGRLTISGGISHREALALASALRGTAGGPAPNDRTGAVVDHG